MEKFKITLNVLLVTSVIALAISYVSILLPNIPESLVREIWSKCQENMGKFQGMFGNNFIIVDNTEYHPISKSVQKQVDAFLRKPIYNQIGKKWIETAKMLKNANIIK